MTIICLQNRSLLQVSGPDRISFLQGLLTCDVKQLPAYGAMLTPNGRFLYDFFVTQHDNDTLFLECQRDHDEEILKKLNFYKLRSCLEIKRCPEWCVYLAWDEAVEGYDDPRVNKDFGKRIYSPPRMCGDDNAAYQERRMIYGIPEPDSDLISGRSIVLEYNFDYFNAISFDKGCYLGQELMARTHHQGLVRKRVLPFKIIEGAVSTEEDIMCEGSRVGEVLSVGTHYGLAKLQVDFIDATLYTERAQLQTCLPSWFVR